MKNLAIISARSGSKGLVNKNIKELKGKPLIAYSIDAAKKSGLFENVMVSTDSALYADIAREWGAEVPFLRSELTSSDKASSWAAVKEVLSEYKKLGKEFDTVTLLQPTSPLRIAEDIQEGYRIFNEKKANYVVGVCEVDHSPLWSSTLAEDLKMDGFFKPDIMDKPRQELPTYYRINGALYIVKVSKMDKVEEMYTHGCYAYVMPQSRSVDIDTAIDFKIAEVLLSQ